MQRRQQVNAGDAGDRLQPLDHLDLHIWSSYYEKKRAEGKRHNQAIRALGRHICRVIFKMLSQERPYRIDP